MTADRAELGEEERESLDQLALLYGTFMVGRWAEVMASDDEPADDWQEVAAREVVALFMPAALDLFTQRTQAARAEALNDAADEVRRVRRDGLRPGEDAAPSARHFEDWLRARAEEVRRG